VSRDFGAATNRTYGSTECLLQNNGVLSNNRRKQLIGKGHPTAIIDKAMAVLTECLADADEARPAPVALG
jgi:hypothetical protein